MQHVNSKQDRRLTMFVLVLGAALVAYAPTYAEGPSLFDPVTDDKVTRPSTNQPGLGQLETVQENIESDEHQARFELMPVPPSTEVDRALKLISETYGPDLASPDRATRELVIQRMMEIVETNHIETGAVKYALLETVRQHSERNGDVYTAERVIDVLVSLFKVDAKPIWKVTAEGLQAGLVKSRGDFTPLVQLYVRIANEALNVQDLDLATSAATSASTLAARIKDLGIAKSLRADAVAIQSTVADIRNLAPAEDTLSRSPDDGVANHTVGWYWGAKRWDWTKGMPYLEKSSEPLVRSLALRSRSLPTDASDQVSLADAWWSFSETLKDNGERDAVRGYAAEWYRVAEPGLTGIQQDRVKLRIKQVNSSTNPRTIGAPKSMQLAPSRENTPAPRGQTSPPAPAQPQRAPVAVQAGVSAQGNALSVVYLVDASGTMMTKFDLVRGEVIASVKRLAPDQKFNIIAFQGDSVMVLSERKLVPATDENKTNGYDFMERTTARGGTNPEAAITEAFSQSPQIIYFITDGLDAVAQQKKIEVLIEQLNQRRRTKLNVLYLGNSKDVAMFNFMNRIAAGNGGVVRIPDGN